MRDETPLESLRSGRWLTAERLRVYPAMVGGALMLMLAGLALTSHAAKDLFGRPLGVDFSGIWVAGHAVLAGHPTQPYDNAAHAAAQVAAFGVSDSFLPWPYPPYFLAVAAFAALLPYLVALALWQGATLALYLVAIRAALSSSTALPRRDVTIAALAFPAVAVNLAHGQNGCLSAGLLVLGALALPRRPLLAGVLLGLLAYKPQFALALPVALLAGGYWRAIVVVAATVLVMTMATWLAFGSAPWQAFFAGLAFTRQVILEQGGLESWKLQSAFAAVRLVGGGVAPAYAVQALVSVLALAGLARLWRGPTDHRIKGAALCLATLISTPYCVDYDLVVIGPAIALLVAHGLEQGFAPWEKSLLAAAWAMPLVARMVAMSVDIPLGIITTAGLFAFVVVSVGRPEGRAVVKPPKIF